MSGRDRRAAIIASATINGIDFVEVANAAQTMLVVHFLNAVPVRGTLLAPPAIEGGDVIRRVAVLPVADGDWGIDGGHVTLTLRVAAPGDFSSYRLTVRSAALDRVFDHATFSFKAGCPSDLDCRPPPVACPPATADAPPIDYLARDFLGFRRALLDFSAQRYPDWQERSEADFGMVVVEALSALADDFSYMQDRVAAEATLATATQRRSAVRHARLIDDEPAPALSAQVMLQFDVAPGTDAIPDGITVTAAGGDGGAIAFETGTSLPARLLDPLTGQPRTTPPAVPASALWNAGLILPYWFDDGDRCLPAGATAMYVLGRGYSFRPGQYLLVETAAESPGDPPIRQVVRLLDADDLAGTWSIESSDPLFPRAADPPGAPAPWLAAGVSPPGPTAPTAVTRIAWRAADALMVDRDLTRTVLAGNIAPATQGRTVAAETLAVGDPPFGDPAEAAIARTGPRGTRVDGSPGEAATISLHTLRSPGLAWLAQGADGAAVAVPEIVVVQAVDTGADIPWRWHRWLLDAGRFDAAFTIDAARFVPVARGADGRMHRDYADGDGDTLRFGDGDFGLLPADGARFRATYRVGEGAAGNVAAGAITRLGPAAIAAGLVAVTNPLPASGGADAEPLDRIARRAPQAFRARTYRAVVPADYRAAAETLPWVQRAGATFRWTGSWTTVFTTPDPRGSERVAPAQRLQLVDLINRYRIAGYENYVPDPSYASLDLLIELCAAPAALRGDVLAGVVATLAPAGAPGRGPGFFAPDRFTFGQPLERSTLEAAIQRVSGVGHVLCIRYRMRDRMRDFAPLPASVAVADDQILRCDNDPSRAERGTFRIDVEGGR